MSPLVVLLLLLNAAAAAAAAFSSSTLQPPPPCSRSCAALNCDSVGIRYGKYCGVGWSGCDGEEPCDDLDACCRDHDHCVDKKGLMSVKCHDKFKNCMRKVKKAGKVGFSKKMPVRDSYGNNDSRDGHGHHAQPVEQPEAGTLVAALPQGRLHVDSHSSTQYHLEDPRLEFTAT